MTSKTHINTEKVACLRNERVVKRAALPSLRQETFVLGFARNLVT